MSTPPSSSQLVWLITGTSSGLGEAIAREALKRGDLVIATARKVDKLRSLQEAGASTLALDTTDSVENLRKVAEEANGIYGRIDVLVNSAAYLTVTSIEEGTAEETFAQFNTNVFGVLNITRAILPYMRSRRTGKVVMIGSMVGWIGLPAAGLYTSTKFAIRGLAETLDLELTPLGIRCHYIEPGEFRTHALSGGSRIAYRPRIPDYHDFCSAVEEGFRATDGNQPGDPLKFATVFVDIVRKEGVASGREIPTGLSLGSDTIPVIRDVCERTLKVLKDWEDVIKSTDLIPARQ